VTTEYVLVETGNMLSRKSDRSIFTELLDTVQTDSAFKIVLGSKALFLAGIALFASRKDKEWSVVDCISFEVMKRRRLHDALTADHHFEQAGFRAANPTNPERHCTTANTDPTAISRGRIPGTLSGPITSLTIVPLRPAGADSPAD
jgi:predicted nucleic acid-binding protein